ncbi:MAG: CBS domain-containing protein, partial [Anaerolineae bacterium]
PGQELLVALGGPMANAGVAILLAALAFIAEPLTPLRLFSQIWLFGTPTISAVLRFVLFLNIALFVFNLVPAFPLDGGIAVRAGLALLMPYERATVRTSALSAVLASGIAIYGLTRIGLRGPGTVIFWLLLAAVLLWGALREESAVVRQRSLVLVRVGDVHDLVTTRLDPQTRVTGDPAAVFARQQIVGVIAAGAPRGEPAAAAMRRDFPTVHPDVTLWAAFREMRSAQLTVLPVVKNGQFLGLLTLDHIERARRYRRTN